MAFSDPKSILSQLSFEPGTHLADLGAGAGAFSLAASTLVGENGVVYAVDVQKEILKKLQTDVRARGVSNIRFFWGDIEEVEGTKLPPATMDHVVIANTLFAVEDRKGALREASRLLTPHGKLVIVDWSDSFGSLGPPPNEVFTEQQARALAEEGGFRFEKELEAGDHHYGLVFARS